MDNKGDDNFEVKITLCREDRIRISIVVILVFFYRSIISKLSEGDNYLIVLMIRNSVNYHLLIIIF